MCVKIASSLLLIACNIILGLCGISLLIVGIIFTVSPDLFFNFVEGKVEMEFDITEILDVKIVSVQVGSLLISVGGALIVLSLLGVCGAMLMSCLKIIYIVGLGFVIVFSASSTVYMASAQRHESMRQNLEKSFVKTYTTYIKNPEILANDVVSFPNNDTKIWFLYQTKHECCGTDNINPLTNKNLTVPVSCCQLVDQTANLTLKKSDYTNSFECQKSYPKYGNIQSCITPFYASILKQSHVGIITLSIAELFMVLCLTLSVI